MRKIKITRELKDKVEQFCDDLFVSERQSVFELPVDRLVKLKKSIKGINKKLFREYIDKIIDDYDDIIRATPAKMKTLITEFDKILPHHRCAENIPKKSIFWEEIVKAMRYEDLRSVEFPIFLQQETLKSCVYCNAQLTVVVDLVYYDKKRKKKIKEKIARLELDHFYPKSKFPFLCTSFYNLYPVCGNCNKSKSSKPAFFELYTTSNNLDVFEFNLNESSILDYWLSRDHSDIKVVFRTEPRNNALLENHNELFKIQGIYDTQVDLAEELLHKFEAYTPAYKKSLVNTLTPIFPDVSLIDRLLIGNYVKPEEIHKRPMAKFIQDIARQLGLL